MARVVIKDLVKTYGPVFAVKDVSLTVDHGEFVALVGPSGCGKTTTLNLVAGLIPITSGDITIGDRVVNDLDPKDRDIAMVFQNYALYPNKSVYKNLAFPLQMRKLPASQIDQKVREAARMLDISHLMDRKPRELSGGQQQRVALGRALVRDPAVFLMDEPLSNLDAKLRVQMRSEIKRFHQDFNATVIYVTHDQLEAVTMADKMAVMNGGLLQQYDTPAQVFANPLNLFVASFIGSPAMSLVPLEIGGEGGQVTLSSTEGWKLDLTERNANKVRKSTTRKIVLGARHSTIRLHKNATAGGVPAKVYTVEPTGDVTFVQVFLSGAVVNISLPPTLEIRPDEQVWLEFDQDRIHLFDAETELALVNSMSPRLKITAIKAYPVWVGIRNQLIVKVETDQGVYGWGESGLSSREKAVMGAVEHYGAFLLGQDAMQIGRIWQEMYRSQYFEGGRVLQAAISAIDIALHDIKGKALGVPVYELLGGKQRDFVPTFATTRSETSSAEVVEQVLELQELGWEAIRLIPAGQKSERVYEPRESIAATAHWTVKCREALGEATALGIDFHHRLSVAEAASYCQKMPRGTLDFLEEPIRDETPGAYSALRKLTDVPFAIGEEFASKWQFLPFIEGDITQFNRIDICNVGGLTEAMKIAGWTEAHYIDMMPHNPLGPICTAASVHFAAAVANFAWLETRASPGELYHGFDNHELFPGLLTLEGARYRVSDKPGLGIDVNEELAARQAFRMWEAPHLVRKDGSVTNW